MAAPSVTYTFVNGAVADASQVNQNFTDLVNGLTDGSGDLTIDTLATNGYIDAYGSLTLGGAGTDRTTYLLDVANTLPVRFQQGQLFLTTGSASSNPNLIDTTNVYAGSWGQAHCVLCTLGSGTLDAPGTDPSAFLTINTGAAYGVSVIFGQYQGATGTALTPEDTLVWKAAAGAAQKADLYSGSDSWQDYFSSSTVVGWGTPSGTIYYKRFGKTVLVSFFISGTSNSTECSFTLPYAASVAVAATACGRDAGITLTTPAFTTVSGSTDVCVVYKDMAAATWTASGNKFINGQFWYQIA